MNFDYIKCSGMDVLFRLEELRKEFSITKKYPFIIGDEEELEIVLEEIEDADQTASTIIAESFDIDIASWFITQELEAAEDEIDNKEILGEWFGEAQEKEGIFAHKDLSSGAIKPSVYIGLATIENPWMLPSVMNYGGWNDCPHPATQCAIMRYWSEQYGAEIVSLSKDTIECKVEYPPDTKDAAIKLAWEQFWYCKDIVGQGTQTISNLAAGLMNANYWFFWWD